MKSYNFIKLSDYKKKRMALILCVIYTVYEVAVRLFPLLSEMNLKLVDYNIAFMLFLVISSKEKIEDERIKVVRAYSTRFTFYTLIFLLALNSLAEINLDTTQIAIGAMMLYLLVFYLVDRFEPNFIFKE